MVSKLEHDYKRYPELTNAELEMFELTSPHVQIKNDFEAVVVKVHDGDTVRLRTTFRDFDFPLRLLDIDAPELSEGGEEVRDWLKARVLNEKVEIRINKFNRVGKYGRLLGKLVAKGFDMGETMLQLGMVKPFGAKNQDKIPSVGKLLRLNQWF
jgi:endonuclease YncB( thermonuclease family)